jgi:hypothetical protein
MQLPLYQCHKRVRAAKIYIILDTGGSTFLCLEGSTKVPVTDDWLKRNPEVAVGGYYVMYEDGYTAYSPNKAFEEGYSAVPPEPVKRPTMGEEIEQILNRYSAENGCNTPDFILADYLMGCLHTFNIAVLKRESWYGRK